VIACSSSIQLACQFSCSLADSILYYILLLLLLLLSLQPAIDMRTSNCYITSQNHGYAVDAKSLPEGWKTFFVNANDFSNEGIIHETKVSLPAYAHSS
jgi:Glutamine amidotransferase class-I